MSDTKPSSHAFFDTYTRPELTEIAIQFMEKAQLKHREARLWRSRHESASAELKALKANRRLP